MKTILDVINTIKRKRIVAEFSYFKSDYKRYYLKEIEDGSREFWAYSTRSTDSFFLGRCEPHTDTVIRPKDFRQLPWDVQKGAQRLFITVGVYLEQGEY